MKNVIEQQNPRDNKKLIQAIKDDGMDKLHVIADFDRTLTKTFVNGKKIPSLISILRDHNYLTPNYPAKAKALYKKYHAMEIDPRLTDQQKRQAMREWWDKHFTLFKQSGLTKQDIERAMTAGKIQLRPGAREFFTILQQNNIPLVIMSSSGIGDYSIEVFLKHNRCLLDNIFIISNRYNWDQKGKMVGVQEPIIHSLNKNETLIKDFPVYQKIKNRPNVILLGDNLADVDMVTGFKYNHLITIGFLNDNIELLLEQYKKTYNVILANDAPMDYVNAILTTIIFSHEKKRDNNSRQEYLEKN